MKRLRAGLAGAGFRRLGGRPAAAILVRAFLWASLGALGGLCVTGCAAQQKKDQATVKALQISGNREISSREIKKKILTTQTGWWPFASKHLFDPVAWQADLKRIERLYVSRGFYQAEVVKDQVTPQPPDAVRLALQVSEGPQTHVGKIDVLGLEQLPAEDRAAATARLPVAVGAVFLEGDWAAAKEKVIAALRGRGYAKAAVDAQALVDVKTHLAALTLFVRPGLRYAFGAIEITDGQGARISPVAIWEQVRLAIPEGQHYSDEALDEAQRRVFAMGVFATVKVTVGTADDAHARLPVKVDVREAPFHTLKLGVGGRVDQIRNEALLIGEWSHRNFLGGMRKLTAHAEAGWAFIPNVYDVNESGARNGPVADLSLQFEQPRFLNRPSLREQSKIEVQRTLEEAYDAISASLTNGVIWQPRSRLTIFPSYHIEGDYLNGPPVSSAATAPLTLGCDTTSDHCFVWLSYLEQVVTWDRRDQALEPRKGFYTSLSLQEGGGPLGGDFSYFRVLPDVRGYFSVGEDNALTFSARLRVGELWPTSGNPEDSAVVTRFYGGGAVSMRGFNDRRLSPLLLVPAPASAPGVTLSLPVGGDGMIDGSFEARYSLTQALRLAAFVDYGQVTTAQVAPSDAGHLLWAVGLGLRYLTPIGPLRLDVARRLPFGRLPPLYAPEIINGTTVIVEQPPYAVDEGCFGLFSSHPVTPVTDGLCVLQISIGEAY
jgi:translocation and assembly module TamA